MKKINLLDYGFVELIDFMGSDQRVLQAARVSTGGNPSNGEAQDRGLIRYLYRNKHTSPFEKIVFEFHVKCPIFVARQWMRHRTQSYNEYSGRYTTFEPEIYSPDVWRAQGDKNHQGSGEPLPKEQQEWLHQTYSEYLGTENKLYDEMLERGVTREMARFIVPVSQYTEFYTTVNLWNLFHFLHLRLHEHAQYEIQVYAQAILKILEGIDEIKWSVEIFKEMNELEYLFQQAVNKDKELKSFKTYLEKFMQN